MSNLQGSLNDFAAPVVSDLFVEGGQVYLDVVDGTHWVLTDSHSGTTTLSTDPGDPGSAETEADGVLWGLGNKRITVWKPTGIPYATALIV